MIIIPGSLIVQLVFQFRDFKVDKKTKIRNTTQKLGRFKIKKLLFILSLTIIAGVIIIFFSVSPEYQIALLLGSIILGIIAVSWVKKLLNKFQT
jgi:hypothetical protein